MGTLFEKAAEAGHNSRHFDVERTARELTSSETWRAQFLRVHAGPKASKKQLIDAHALIDQNLTAEEYRLLRLRLYFCNEACDNYWVSTDREAALLNRSTSAIERASSGLERTEEDDNYQVSQRRRNQSSIRAFSTPAGKLEAAKELLALWETANVRLLEPAYLRVDSPEPADLQLRIRRSEGLTLLKNSKEKEYWRSEDCPPAACAMRKPSFEQFWGPYPNKSGKARATQIWAKMPIKDCVAAINGIARYTQCDKFKKGFIQQGDTYLTKRTWDDESLLAPSKPDHPNGCDETTLERALEYERAYQNGKGVSP